jgi:hypothetical protein
MSKYYYFDNTNLDTYYPTLWKGYIKYGNINSNNNHLNIIDIDNILIDICDINFYINIDGNDGKIYISLCQDSKYYYHQFEKHIKKVISKLEEFFNIVFINAEFYANEVKHLGNQYKYTIDKLDNKVVLKKKTLNWSVIDKSINNIDMSINKLSLK